jgi:hypothetical protein
MKIRKALFHKIEYSFIGKWVQGNPPSGSDWVGYETLIDFIVSHNILSIAGDLVEIGAFLGGGTRKLSELLTRSNSSKKLYVIDIFDPTFDCTTNTSGSAMNTLYVRALDKYPGQTQEEVFSYETRNCRNITVLKGDSKAQILPAQKLCFGFIDGNHSPEYVENDFYQVWNKLTPKGAVALHDYKGDLPQVTAKIGEIVSKHSAEIEKTLYIKNKKILFITKKDQT